jgi:LysR family transcriptional activator of glutamate synthase operon
LITDLFEKTKYDIIFCSSNRITREIAGKIEKMEFCTDNLVAVMHKDHPLANKPVIDLKDLTDELLVLLDQTNPTYYICNNLFKKVGITPKVYFEGSRIELVLECVSRKMGISLLMKAFIKMDPTGLIVAREIRPTAKQRYYLVRKAQSDHPQAARLFWDYIAGKIARPVPQAIVKESFHN